MRVVLFAADAASQGLVIAVGAALLSALGLMAGLIYKLFDNTHDRMDTTQDQVKEMRGDLRSLTTTMSAGFERLGSELNHLNREVGELAVRFETAGMSQPRARPRRPGAGEG